MRNALDLLPDSRRTAKLRSIVLVELGATQAAKTYHFLEEARPHELSLQVFEEARRSLFQARSLSPEDYHPIDILGWMTEALLDSGVLDLESEAEVKADILHIFSLADPDAYDPVQKERFLQRRMKIGNLIGRTDMAEDAFQTLVAQGSKAGYYLRASQLAGRFRTDRRLTDSQKRSFSQAVTYLETHRNDIAGDSRCLYLLLRLWWMAKTGSSILFGERQTVGFDQQDWQYALRLIMELFESEGQYPVALLKFLQSLATFHLGWIDNALALFRELEQVTDYVLGRRRIIRSYLASTPSGEPAVFHGTVAWIDNEQRRGQAYVEELRCRIPMFPIEFARGRELRQGDPIGRFHIAFNFIGPMADPTPFYRG